MIFEPIDNPWHLNLMPYRQNPSQREILIRLQAAHPEDIGRPQLRA